MQIWPDYYMPLTQTMTCAEFRFLLTVRILGFFFIKSLISLTSYKTFFLLFEQIWQIFAMFCIDREWKNDASMLPGVLNVTSKYLVEINLFLPDLTWCEYKLF